MKNVWVLFILLMFIVSSLYAGRTYTLGTGVLESTVLDDDTGLRWTRCSMLAGGVIDSNAGCIGGHADYSWTDAVSACENLVFAGISSWRLPNIRELHSIVRYYKVKYPRIDEIVFPGMPEVSFSSHFWSSTVYTVNQDRAWFFDFVWGSSAAKSKDEKSFVRCVTGP